MSLHKVGRAARLAVWQLFVLYKTAVGQQIGRDPCHHWAVTKEGGDLISFPEGGEGVVKAGGDSGYCQQCVNAQYDPIQVNYYILMLTLQANISFCLPEFTLWEFSFF